MQGQTEESYSISLLNGQMPQGAREKKRRLFGMLMSGGQLGLLLILTVFSPAEIPRCW